MQHVRSLIVSVWALVATSCTSGNSSLETAFSSTPNCQNQEYLAPNKILIKASFQPSAASPAPSSQGGSTPDSTYTRFLIEFSLNDQEVVSPAYLGKQYSEVVQTADYRMAQYVTLKTAQGKEIPLTNYVVDKTFGLGLSNRFLFIFAPVPPDEKLTLLIREWGLGCGPAAFTFQLPCPQ